MVYEAPLHNFLMSPHSMGPEQLRAVAAFARVAQHASFSKAAATLGVSPSALSQTIRALEDRVGIRLLNRTTRRVGVTEAGALFLQRVLPALDQFTAAFTELDELRGTPTGTLRVSLPRIAMTTIVVPLLRDFCGAYPQIRLEVIADDRFVDLVGEGYDAGIRLGERLAQGMIAVRATREQRSAVVGSPAYFAVEPSFHLGGGNHRCAPVVSEESPIRVSLVTAAQVATKAIRCPSRMALRRPRATSGAHRRRCRAMCPRPAKFPEGSQRVHEASSSNGENTRCT